MFPLTGLRMFGSGQVGVPMLFGIKMRMHLPNCWLCVLPEIKVKEHSSGEVVLRKCCDGSIDAKRKASLRIVGRSQTDCLSRPNKPHVVWGQTTARRIQKKV